MSSKSSHSMRTSAYLFLLAGLSLFIALIGYYGVAAVASALAVAGWGLIWVSLFHLVVLVLVTAAWRALLDREQRLAFKTLLWIRWIGESIKGLLPVAQVGGDLVKARLAKHCGLPGDVAGASVVVDVTVSVVTQIIFVAIGVGLLLRSGAPKIVVPVLTGLGIMALLVTSFYVVQRRGFFAGIAGALKRFSGNKGLHAFVGGAVALDDAINRIYRNPRAVLYSALYRLLGWIAASGEVWLALYFLDVPTTLATALLLESLGQAVCSAAFLIPGAMGVQEGGFLLLGGLVGLSPEVALALSLIKRVRVLLLGIPGLICWQISEGRRLRRLHHRDA